jgi:hypothetical protein
MIIRTSPPRWTRGEKRALAAWATFALLLVSGLIFLAVRVVTSISHAAHPPSAQHNNAARAPSTPAAAVATLPPDFRFAPNGVAFTPLPADPAAAPRVVPLTVPEFEGYSAIWGATGRDHRGHVWLGVSTRGQGGAHLIEFDPATQTLTDRGNVHDQLHRLGLKKPGLSQIKIHSRIEQAPDGYLYFTSMDEQGEKEDGSANPTWGSHLWRVAPGAPTPWEHLAAMPQGMIALACGGRMVYTLGYHGHVVHQYDTQTGATRSIEVGSVGGHISRNFAVDRRDHVYVPRLRRGAAGAVSTQLVELDPLLAEVAATPLEHYIDGPPAQSHGIIGVQPMTDGSIVFITNFGMLYRITPPVGAGDSRAAVAQLGFLHPEGARYIASLFTYDGKSHVMGVCQRGQIFEWVCHDLSRKQSTTSPLVLSYPDQRKVFKHLLYGSITRDSTGAFFVVGTDQNIDRPVVLRLTPP